MISKSTFCLGVYLLLSLSGAAKEHNVEERENFGRNYEITDEQTDLEFEIAF